MAKSLLSKFEGGLRFNEIESYTSKARTWYFNELKSINERLWDIENEKRLLRPENSLKPVPGEGYGIFKSKNKRCFRLQRTTQLEKIFII